jgi:hypothetical protein
MRFADSLKSAGAGPEQEQESTAELFSSTATCGF